MSRFLPCPACGRHVRAEGEACPFCEAPLAFEAPSAPRLLSRAQLTRAAIFAGATALAAACGGTQSGADPESDPESNSFIQPYGAPAIDEEEPIEQDTGEERAGDTAEPQGVAPPYGAPAIDDDSND